MYYHTLTLLVERASLLQILHRGPVVQDLLQPPVLLDPRASLLQEQASHLPLRLPLPSRLQPDRKCVRLLPRKTRAQCTQVQAPVDHEEVPERADIPERHGHSIRALGDIYWVK